jgi:hypothetical protein
MADEIVKQEIDRRDFLRAAAAAMIAASAAGTGAALLMEQKQAGLIAISPPIESLPIPSVANPGPEFVTLRSQMAAVQAENFRLQTQLASAQGQLELIGRSNDQQYGSQVEVWQLQLDDANSQVASLGGQVTLLAGLVELYEHLDAVDLTAVASEGVATVSSILTGVIEEMPAVSEGIQAGREALDDFEEQIPSLEEGQRWLIDQVELLDGLYAALETALQNSVDVAGTFLQRLNQWFQDILKWLPFGLGDRAATIMNALADLLESVPETIEGAQTRVAGPLDLWLERDGQETHLHKQLIRPVRIGVLDKASKTVTQVEALDFVYQSRLAEPVIAAVERQQLIRDQIETYRQNNLL